MMPAVGGIERLGPQSHNRVGGIGIHHEAGGDLPLGLDLFADGVAFLGEDVTTQHRQDENRREKTSRRGVKMVRGSAPGCPSLSHGSPRKSRSSAGAARRDRSCHSDHWTRPYVSRTGGDCPGGPAGPRGVVGYFEYRRGVWTVDSTGIPPVHRVCERISSRSAGPAAGRSPGRSVARAGHANTGEPNHAGHQDALATAAAPTATVLKRLLLDESPLDASRLDASRSV